MSGFFDVRVTASRLLTPVIREFTFEALAGSLPGYSAGSHVQVCLPNGRRNAYSLVGDTADPHRYRIAVRRQDASRGGSRYLHEHLRVGDPLRLSTPANCFALHSGARRHLLIAGGIGITPFIAYSHELLRRGVEFELHFAYRGGLSDAYLAELRELLGERLHGYDGDCRVLDLDQVLRQRPLGSHVYACGPQRLLEALRARAAALGWHASRVHWEAFSAPAPGQPFSVELSRSGQRLEVSADQSLLEALEGAGVDIPNLCRGGVCGQCHTRYLKGEVEHRDHFLTPGQRGDGLMPCVSRGRGSLLLDL